MHPLATALVIYSNTAMLAAEELSINWFSEEPQGAWVEVEHTQI